MILPFPSLFDVKPASAIRVNEALLLEEGQVNPCVTLFMCHVSVDVPC